MSFHPFLFPEFHSKNEILPFEESKTEKKGKCMNANVPLEFGNRLKACAYKVTTLFRGIISKFLCLIGPFRENK